MSFTSLMRFYIACGITLLGIMSGVTFLLIKEYYYFKEQVEELATLKEEYAGHVITLKRMFLESEQLEEECEAPDEKKKNLREDLL
jgi:hypothetical protein